MRLLWFCPVGFWFRIWSLGFSLFPSRMARIEGLELKVWRLGRHDANIATATSATALLMLVGLPTVLYLSGKTDSPINHTNHTLPQTKYPSTPSPPGNAGHGFIGRSSFKIRFNPTLRAVPGPSTKGGDGERTPLGGSLSPTHPRRNVARGWFLLLCLILA